ncbi:MAG: uridine diphosphate-N-acetylglucosamine-binding protein YvcK [Acidobacteria bacterium]|nr:uridine diphosphate-N-acetylglucosamine-binding protein YvcK [Acidobacteriota bacterium]
MPAITEQQHTSRTATRPASEARRRPRIVAIGGGTGLPVVLRGLVEARTERWNGVPHLIEPRLTAIVTVTDDGGNSGRLRRDLGMLPPGDVRGCLTALAAVPPTMGQLLQHRFTGSNSLNGHAVGNLLLAAMTQMSGGDFVAAVERLCRILNVRGRILPSTREDVRLKAEFDGGELRTGETAIVAWRARIRRLWLERAVRPLPEAVRALINADAIVVGPGSLYTSILPNLLVDGIAATIYGVNAVRIYVANLMTEPGETDGFTLHDHLRVIQEHVGFNLFDYVLVNRRPLESPTLVEYAQRGARPVLYGPTEPVGPGGQLVERDLAWSYEGGKIRHAPGQLASAILELVAQGRSPRSTASPISVY